MNFLIFVSGTLIIKNDNSTMSEYAKLTFLNISFILIYVNRNELPQLIKDFTRTLSIKTIPNIHNINIRIKTFNYNIVKNLQNLEEKKKKQIFLSIKEIINIALSK